MKTLLIELYLCIMSFLITLPIATLLWTFYRGSSEVDLKNVIDKKMDLQNVIDKMGLENVKIIHKVIK